MTEAGPVLSMCLSFAKEPFEIKSGACGTVVRNAEMKIIDPETASSLPRNQAGEICIRGNQIMKGKHILQLIIYQRLIIYFPLNLYVYYEIYQIRILIFYKSERNES